MNVPQNTTATPETLLWPTYAVPTDITTIEATPISERGLPATTYNALARAAQLWPNRTAVTVLPSAGEWRKPHTKTFNELLFTVHRYANLLHALGVRRHGAVAIMSPNTAESIPILLATQLAGTAAPINPDLSAEQVKQLLRRSGARVLIVAGPELSAPIWETGREIAAELKLDALIALRPTAPEDEPPLLEPAEGVHTAYLFSLSGTHPGDRLVHVREPAHTDLSALFHTGGTTSTPKLAAHTHANEVSDAWMIATNSMLDHNSVIFAALPLFHVNALVVTVLSPLLRGQHVVWAGPLGYREPALFAQFWQIVHRYRLAAMSGVPTVYAALSAVPVNADISSLRLALVGASPLPPAVRTAFEEHTGVTLAEGYGLTEATCASARTFPDQPRTGSVGQRMPYQQAKTITIDEDGGWHDQPAGELGILAIKGPTVFPGYVASATDEGPPRLDPMGKIVDGWLETGDLARVDEEGFIFLLGRAKDLIIRGGHNIDPAVIEDALLAHPAVAAANAVGQPDPHAGEVPVAYVSLRPGVDATEADILSWVADRIPERAAIPKVITILDTLPVTAVGKPYKVALRADATVREFRRALAETADLGDYAVTCDGSSGALIATVRAPNDDTIRTRIRTVLDRYSINWTFASTS